MNENANTPIYSFNNKGKLGNNCGCYACCEAFATSEIKEWTDGSKTAICPKCGIDSVLPESIIGIQEPKNVLKQINEYWFPKQKA